MLLLLLSRFSHVRLCDPMDCSLPASSVHGIFQAIVLKWIAISSIFLQGLTLGRMGWNPVGKGA